jgi:alpha-L-rhamnosidase
MSLSISHVSFEHHREALGIAEPSPRISWRFQGSVIDWEQASYHIQIRRHDGTHIAQFDVESSNSLLVNWPDTPLSSCEQAQVRVRADGKTGQPSTPWSSWTSVETGLLNKDDWGAATAIMADRTSELEGPKRPIYFRKAFDVSGNIKAARLYITSLGVYQAELNTTKVGDDVLAPGWQSYHHRQVYNTYDVTELVRPGRNAIGVVVGEGWYSGILGFGGGRRNNYGDTVGLLALLVVTRHDGTRCQIPTDLSWRANVGPMLSSEIYNGEVYDSRLEAGMTSWSTGDFDHQAWLSVRAIPGPLGALVSPDGPPVRRIEERRPLEITHTPSGRVLLDFGQNLVGWLRVTVTGSHGASIKFRFAEVLEHGELAVRPLRLAKPVDTLITNGVGQTWEPHFTYHGFRYADITGWPENEALADSITAVVIHTDMEMTGSFQCSNPLLNQFHKNVQWSMKGNFFSVPTDCPQRDERLGWTGDVLAFGPTANYLYDTSGFWRGWHKDLWAEMQEGGKMVPPFFTPTVETKFPCQPTAVWGDVAVVNPWNAYQAFGDEIMLREQFPQSQAWVDVGIPRRSDGLWARDIFQFGDWLDPKAPPESPDQAATAKDLVADAYLVRTTKLMAEMARAIGHSSQAEEYHEQYRLLQQRFLLEWANNGTLASPTQTAYALALHFDIFLGDQANKTAAQKLRDLVVQSGYLIETGFAGTPSLGFALEKTGAVDCFYRMLLQTRLPSWLYQVVQGGTTTWERWDSLLENGEVNPGEMTSFNHYAFGSVADWMHQVIGGLRPLEPGWRRFMIAPVPGGGLVSAETSFLSPYGQIRVQWWFEQNEEENARHRNGFYLNASIPPNTRAEVKLPREKDVKHLGSGFFQYHDPYFHCVK